MYEKYYLSTCATIPRAHMKIDCFRGPIRRQSNSVFIVSCSVFSFALSLMFSVHRKWQQSVLMTVVRLHPLKM